ncbi:MAG: N-acetylmuramoyl-L-alanine amidase [Saprospiraceae bacterium]
MRTFLDEIFEMETPTAHKKPCGCGCGCPTCSGAAETALHEMEYEDELGPSEINSAVAYNRSSAAQLGWGNRRNDIVGKLLRLNFTPDEPTFAALVSGWQLANGLTADGKIGQKTWEAMQRILAQLLSGTLPVPSGGIEDFTARATPARCASARNASSCLGGTRPLSNVNAVVLHQTAGGLNNDPNHYLWVGAHFVVLPNGRIIQLYPESRVVYHANSFNSRSVGIEFAGTFASDTGKCWWDSGKYVNRGYGGSSRMCGEPTAAQIASGRRLLTALKTRIPSLKYVFAHRQASSSRDNDPGPTVWLQVGEWAKQRLGLSDGGNYKEGSGNPIPDSWRRGTITP